ncbi:MAG: 6-carboxytetrahydropterin synthase [Singulisphaera sp.]
MFRVTREIDFCYGHRLLNYDGKCKYLHGHNGRAVIVLEGESLDHRMLLHRNDPMVPLLREMNEPIYLLNENPTAENIAKLIYEFTAAQGFPIVEARLWETPRCFATYRR